MDILNEILQNTDINFKTVVIRLVISFIAGSLVGYERERDAKSAGLRTHALICVGASVLMILSIYIPQTYPNFQNGDPGRIAAQVVSGIGFLGAGAIIRLGVNVKGLTTAASIWVVAALGLVIGAGMYLTALATLVVVLIILIVLHWVEKKLIVEKDMKLLYVNLKTDDFDVEYVQNILKKFKITISSTNIIQSFTDRSVKLKFLIKIPQNVKYRDLYTELSKIENISKIHIEHHY